MRVRSSRIGGTRWVVVVIGLVKVVVVRRGEPGKRWEDDDIGHRRSSYSRSYRLGGS
jgi:hypothetical protein